MKRLILCLTLMAIGSLLFTTQAQPVFMELNEVPIRTIDDNPKLLRSTIISNQVKFTIQINNTGDLNFGVGATPASVPITSGIPMTVAVSYSSLGDKAIHKQDFFN